MRISYLKNTIQNPISPRNTEKNFVNRIWYELQYGVSPSSNIEKYG